MGTPKRVRISHGKRAIGVRAIEVRLYIEMQIRCLVCTFSYSVRVHSSHLAEGIIFPYMLHFAICGQQISLAQSDQYTRCPLTESINVVEYFNKNKRLCIRKLVWTFVFRI